MPLNSGRTLTFWPILLIFAPLLLTIACGATNNTPTTGAVSTPIPGSTSTPPSQDLGDFRWVLQSINGRPPIEGTFVFLRVNGVRLGGFDGCNTFGGGHNDGTPVALSTGAFTMPSSIAGTDIGCVDPEGILEQADAFMMALRQSTSFRLFDDGLQMLDEAENVRLVFIRQEPLPGTAARLEGTSWRLLTEDVSGGDVGTATLTFLDARLFEGTTVCRDVEGSYQVSGESIGFPSLGMTGDHSTCSESVMSREAQFTNDLSYADEYSVYQDDGVKRFALRTSRGRTLTFESLPTSSSQ